MENDEPNDGNCAPSGPDAEMTMQLKPLTKSDAEMRAQLFEPPGYLNLLARGLHACQKGGPDDVPVESLDRIARDLRALELTSPDSDNPLILRSHTHVLSAAFARLLEIAMARPLKRGEAIAHALKAQKQCIEVVEVLRLERDIALREGMHRDRSDREHEKLRLMRHRQTNR